jgi:O-phosphoseryl-tRNA(Cys) synthetase
MLRLKPDLITSRRKAVVSILEKGPDVSKAEIERFRKLLTAWRKGEVGSTDDLLNFLDLYEQPLINALRLYAADK